VFFATRVERQLIWIQNDVSYWMSYLKKTSLHSLHFFSVKLFNAMVKNAEHVFEVFALGECNILGDNIFTFFKNVFVTVLF